jgi:hypothetical protein
MSLNPVLGALASEMDSASAAVECLVVGGTDATHMPDCTQHNTCYSFCQLTPLQPAGPEQIRIVRWPWLVHTMEPEDLDTRFLEGIERPPRA